MQEFFYPAIGIIAIVTHLILNVAIVHSPNARTARSYRRFLNSVLFYYVTDVAWGVFSALGFTSLFFATTVVSYLAVALTMALGCFYFLDFLQIRHVAGRYALPVIVGLTTLVIIGLGINFYTPFFFNIDAHGHFQSQYLRLILIAIQILLFLGMSLLPLVRFYSVSGTRTNRSYVIFTYCIINAIMLSIQAFHPEYPLYTIALMFGTMCIHTFIYEADLHTDLEVIRIATQRFFSIYWIDIPSGIMQEYCTANSIRKLIGNEGKAQQMMNVVCQNLVIPEDRERMADFFDMSKWAERLKDNDMFSCEYRGVTTGWSRAYVYAAHRNKKGACVQTIMCGEMIHEELAQRNALNEAREQAEASNRSKTIFLNNMSHDIRTPMNAILGFAELMGRKTSDPNLIKSYLEKIKSSGNYLLSIINNILDMARIESGKMVEDKDFFDFSDPGSNIIPMFAELAKGKNLTFNFTESIEHHYVWLDKLKQHQIVQNLISNAIKYTPEGGSVSCSMVEVPCDKEGYATYVLTISDTGIGMSPEFLETIYDSFSRERTSTESKVVGSGLGMSIVKRLVDLVGGKIEVQSEQGKGTTFKVTISHQLVQNPEQYLKKLNPSPTLTSISLEGKHILMAEDNELNAEIATTILEESGLKVDHALDGIECIKMLTTKPADYYDVILMDVQMPNLNGYDAARRIRQLDDKNIANIPIIALTANAFEEDRRNALNAGMNGHLAKPIDIPRLMTELDNLLSCK